MLEEKLQKSIKWNGSFRQLKHVARVVSERDHAVIGFPEHYQYKTLSLWLSFVNGREAVS